jgi:carbon storage regulator
MLVLTRKCGEKIVINPGPEQIVLTILDIDGSRIRLGIEAPRDVPIAREELLDGRRLWLPTPHGETHDNYSPEE